MLHNQLLQFLGILTRSLQRGTCRKIDLHKYTIHIFFGHEIEINEVQQSKRSNEDSHHRDKEYDTPAVLSQQLFQRTPVTLGEAIEETVEELVELSGFQILL